MQSVAGMLCRGPSVAERVGSPNVTCVQRNRFGGVLACLLPGLLSCQTLRVCGQRVSDLRSLPPRIDPDPSLAVVADAKRYVCAEKSLQGI